MASPAAGRLERVASTAGVALALEAVSVRLGGLRAALSDLTFEIAPGEQVAVIGPSGAGKTTLLSVLGAALAPTAGRVRIGEADPWQLGSRSLRQLRSRVFLAPQTPPLAPRQRVVTAVLAGRLPAWSLTQAITSLIRPRDAQLAARALAQFSLVDKLWSRVDRLSGGERQRVSLARGWVSTAGAFLIDEPLSALDPALASQTLQALTRSFGERGSTLVCSLHQVELALEHFPRVIGLRDGTVMFDREARQVTPDDIARLYFNRDPGAPSPAADEGDADAGNRPSRCF